MNIVRQAYKRAILASNEHRKRHTRHKLDFYFNEQERYILDQIEAHYRSQAKHVMPVFLNLVRKIINLTSSVYILDAKRGVTGTDTDKDTYARFEDTAALPIVMKQANRLCNLTGVVFLRPVFRSGQMMVDVVTPDLVDVTLGDSPQDVRSVTVTQFSENGRPDEVTYSMWTADTLRRLDYNFQEISSEPNPYGVIPFVVVHQSLPTNDFWLDGTANDLVNAQEAVNLQLSGLFYTLFYQGFATGYIKGGGDISSHDLIFGAGSMISLPEGGDVGFVSPKAPITDTIAAITFLLEQIAVQNGLPASVVSTTTREVSGVALTVENVELGEARRDQIALFARAEQQLFTLFRTVWNTHNPTKAMSEAATLKVDFADPQASMTPIDRFNLFQVENNVGAASVVDYLMEKNPDYSREEAQDKILDNLDERERLNPTSMYRPSTGSTTTFSTKLDTGL